MWVFGPSRLSRRLLGISAIEGATERPNNIKDSRSVVPDRRASHTGQLARIAGYGIIAPRRSNSAHLHRPWRADRQRTALIWFRPKRLVTATVDLGHGLEHVAESAARGRLAFGQSIHLPNRRRLERRHLPNQAFSSSFLGFCWLKMPCQ
jgi:hypothetical protein